MASILNLFTLIFMINTMIGNGQQISDVEDVSLVFAIFRDASRNPNNVDKFLSSPAFGGHFRSDEQWKRGSGRLNKLGKQQAYFFGQFLRKRYAKFFANNNDDILDFEIAKAYSANAACNQATLQLVLAGLFPASDNEFAWNNNRNSTGLWQPYLYTVNDRLTATGNTSCLELKKQFETIKEDSTLAAQQWLNDEHRTLTTFTERTGLNASLKHLSELAQFIQILNLYNTSLPAWLLEIDKNPSTLTPAVPADVIESFNISVAPLNASTPIAFAPPETWATKILRFKEAHSQLCANDSECRRSIAGFFLNHLLETLMLKREDKLPKRRLHLYSTRPETLAAIAALFQTTRSQGESSSSTGSPSNVLLIEYRDNPQPSIRILSHEFGNDSAASDGATNLLETTYCQKQEWCRLDIVIKAVGLDTFDDWEKACKTEVATLPCPSGSSNIALVRDALTEQENVAPSENGKKLKSTECAFEWDKSGTRPCRNWASHGYCNLYDSVRWLFCRRTCLCNPEFV